MARTFDQVRHARHIDMLLDRSVKLLIAKWTVTIYP